MKQPPKPTFFLTSILAVSSAKTSMRINKNKPNPKVATRKKIQIPNQKSNPKHKEPSVKVATYATPKVAT